MGARKETVPTSESAEVVLASLDGATTLMLCNVSLSLGGARDVLALLSRAGLLGAVDYLYLPRGYERKSGRRCSGSLSAFLNFSSASAARLCVRTLHQAEVHGRKVSVRKALSQGLVANLLHFRAVRAGSDVLETSWPWVRALGGELLETSPRDAVLALGLEAEVAASRSQAAPASPKALTLTARNLAQTDTTDSASEDDGKSVCSWVTDDGFETRFDTSARWALPLSRVHLTSDGAVPLGAPARKSFDEGSDGSARSTTTHLQSGPCYSRYAMRSGSVCTSW